MDGAAIRRALEADLPSGSEDERLNLSDDSDIDPDFFIENLKSDTSSDESELEVQLDETENSMPGPKTMTPGGDQPHLAASSSSNDEHIPKEWNWASGDVPQPAELQRNIFKTKGIII